MRSIQVKSVILGIGIGIILTSFIGMIFSSGMERAAELNDEYVIRRARELGMLKSTDLLDSGSVEAQDERTDKPIETTPVQLPETTVKEEDEDSAGKQAEGSEDGIKMPPEVIVVEIKSGDSSEKVADMLLEKGLITDRETFADILAEEKLETKIMVGRYSFEKGTGVDEIIRKITSK